MAFLRLKPQDCSPLGQFILQYMEENKLTLTELAEKASLTRPGLRAMCLKRANPTQSSLVRLALAMNKSPVDLFKLVCLNKQINPYNPDVFDLFIKGIEIVFKEMQELTLGLPEQERPSDMELIDRAIDTVRSCMPNSESGKKLSKQ